MTYAKILVGTYEGSIGTVIRKEDDFILVQFNNDKRVYEYTFDEIELI